MGMASSYTLHKNCSNCANNVEYPPPHTCDECTSLAREEEYSMWSPKKDLKGENMNKDLWYKIFKDYVESYKAIQTLQKNHIIEDEQVQENESKLLKDIIVTMESEIAD